MNWYCDYALAHAEEKPLHKAYHDHEYGFPRTDERDLFELFCMEIMQAGLSWDLILKKRQGMKAAFDDFYVDKVARYGERQIGRLLKDANIIRNRLKVQAIIHNAKVVRDLRDSHGGFAGWIAAHHPRRHPDWVKVFRKTFKFTGPEVVNEFLMAIGYLPGSHRSDCEAMIRIKKVKPAWMEQGEAFFGKAEAGKD